MPATPPFNAHFSERLPSDLLRRAAAGDAVALTEALVRIPSVNPRLEAGGAGESEIAACCATFLEGWGFEVALSEPAPGRWNVLARLGGGGRRLLLNGHLDTVGVAAMEDPFGAAIRGGSLYGRGACDMKGGVAAILAAGAALEGETEGELVIALTADEEHASLGMEALVQAGLSADAAVVCEPTELRVMPAHKGFAWVELHFRGRAAHGSRPQAGVDAIRHAGLFLAALDDYGRELEAGAPHPLLGHGSVHAGTIAGGSAPSVYPDSCRLVIERRTLPGEGPAQILEEVRRVLERVRDAVPELDADLRLDLFRPGTEVPENTPLVQGLLAAVREAGTDAGPAAEGRNAGPRDPSAPQREAEVGGMTAWVDAAYLNESGTPAVCFGPGSILKAHGAEELVPVEEVRAAARALEIFTRNFLREAE